MLHSLKVREKLVAKSHRKIKFFWNPNFCTITTTRQRKLNTTGECAIKIRRKWDPKHGKRTKIDGDIAIWRAHTVFFLSKTKSCTSANTTCSHAVFRATENQMRNTLEISLTISQKQDSNRMHSSMKWTQFPGNDSVPASCEDLFSLKWKLEMSHFLQVGFLERINLMSSPEEVRFLVLKNKLITGFLTSCRCPHPSAEFYVHYQFWELESCSHWFRRKYGSGIRAYLLTRSSHWLETGAVLTARKWASSFVMVLMF